MVTIAQKRKQLQIKFPPDATLASVHDDTEEIARRLQQLEDAADVELDCRAIEEIDSCYLQLILMTVCTRNTSAIHLRTGRDNRSMKEMLNLYGVVDGRLHWVED